MKSYFIVIILIILSCFSCNNHNNSYQIPDKYNFLSSSSTFIFSVESDSSLRDSFELRGLRTFELIDNNANYYEIIEHSYISEKKTIKYKQRYYPSTELIKKNIDLIYSSKYCICEQIDNEVYIGDYQVGDIVYKDVVKFTECNCLKEIYVNVYFGIICYIDNDNNKYTFYKAF